MPDVDPRYAVLFEPVAIGPVTARNRFYQVPHCNGAGDSSPRGMAAMRGVKAEGGWGVVCTENLMADFDSDISPFAAVRLWDDDDTAVQALTVEKIHEHGALAGCELAHFGMAAANRTTGEVSLGPSSRPLLESCDPVQSRAMDRADIRAFRRRHLEAAKRAKRAGFDIVYLYCSHENSILSQFFSPYLNDRSDAYGGSLPNRMRLFRELLEEMRDAIGDRCAVAVRFGVEQLQRRRLIEREELHEIVERAAEWPDLWDVNVGDWPMDSATSRFAGEGHEEPLIRFVKRCTTKPVAGVGRFTSPDAMVSQVRRGVLDLVGAARPSIADPFLPRKIEAGRADEIRECIGCNVCVAGENSYTTMRCTQNPTIMEEWRRGWHPETVPPAARAETVLVVGAGPAGLECALTLARRGAEVTVAEAANEFGGRVLRESRLPGLGEWIRVRDYRLHLLRQMPNVELYRGSTLNAEQILAYGFERIVIATGAKWRTDGIGRTHLVPIAGVAGALTPDAVMDGAELSGRVLLYDDDGAYLPPALAERLRQRGCEVTIVTPHPLFARWTALTLEQGCLHERMHERGIDIRCGLELCAADGSRFTFRREYTGDPVRLDADHLLLATSRAPNDALYADLLARAAEFADAGIRSVDRIGDCDAPGLIAHAVFAGHRYAREFDRAGAAAPYRRERFRVGSVGD